MTRMLIKMKQTTWNEIVFEPVVIAHGLWEFSSMSLIVRYFPRRTEEKNQFARWILNCCEQLPTKFMPPYT